MTAARQAIVLALAVLAAIAPARAGELRPGTAEHHAWVKGELERIEELPRAEQEREIPRVYRELSSDWVGGLHLPNGQPEVIVRPGKPVRFVGTVSSRRGRLLHDHPNSVRPLVWADLQSRDMGRIVRAVEQIGNSHLHEFYGEVVAALQWEATESSALRTLCELDDPRAIRVLLERDPDDPLRHYTALASLCARRPAHPVLVRCLRSDDPETRWRALYALSSSGDPRIAADIKRLTHDPDPQVRKQAKEAHSPFVNDEFERQREALLCLMEHHDVAVCIDAVGRFARKKDMACARPLLGLLKDESVADPLHLRLGQALQDLTGTWFNYSVYDPNQCRPTSEVNREAIQRFAAWIEQREGKQS